MGELQHWHIRAEDKRTDKGFIEFDLAEGVICNLLKVLVKQKRLPQVGRVFLEVYCLTNENAREWCKANGIPFIEPDGQEVEEDDDDVEEE